MKEIQIVARYLVSAHSNKNMAISFCPDLKSIMNLMRFSVVTISFLLLSLFTQQVFAQNIFFDDFGTNSTTVRTTTPYMPTSGSFTFGKETVAGVQEEIKAEFKRIMQPHCNPN